MLFKKGVVLWVFSLAAVVTVGVATYKIGVNQNQDVIETLEAEQKQNQEAQPLSLELALEQDVRIMEARLKSIQSNIANLKEQSTRVNQELAVRQYPDETVLEEVQANIATLPRSPDQKAVPLPAESSSARVLAQPKSPSGIPVPVLENYQKETGVNPAEIEALMRRTQ